MCLRVRRPTRSSDGASSKPLSEASQKLGLKYFAFEAVRQQILKEGLEAVSPDDTELLL